MSNGFAQFNQTKVFYDRVALFHHLMFRINGYQRSIEKYFRSASLPISSDSRVLDAGCGTGLLTLAFYGAGFCPKETVAFDLSKRSLELAKKEFRTNKMLKNVRLTQGNILNLPFDDETFDLILTCGVLEYVALDSGLKELRRVLRRGGFLIYIPLFPSFATAVLEIIYRFKAHSAENVSEIIQRNFEIVENYHFSAFEPISWTRSLFRLKKT